MPSKFLVLMLALIGLATATVLAADGDNPPAPRGGPPGPGGPGPGFGGPGFGGFGGPMGAPDAVSPLIMMLAELNLSPDFTLSKEQKEKIHAVRDAFGAEQQKWRTEHEADFKNLADLGAKMFRPGAGGPPGPEQFVAFNKARQELMSTAPDGEESAKQIKAVLTPEQLRKIEGDGDGPRGGGGPGFFRMFFGGGGQAPAGLTVPAGGVPTQPGFYKLKFQTQVKTESGAPRKVNMAYALYLPKGYDTSKEPCPTLIFLHGAGEAGTDTSGVFAHGPALELTQEGGSKISASFPFILICPQCPPRGERWDQPAMPKGVLALLDELSAKVRIDKDRIYITGLSMGGKGSWLLAMEAPDRFAAIAPIAADTLDTKGAAKLKTVAVWAIDGAEDFGGGPENNKQMVQAIQAAGGDAKVSIVPNEGHFVWPKFYADPKFYEWFLTKKRKTAEVH